MNHLVIHANQGDTKISRYHYGHFAEHLGTGIYEGVWVGEASPIPNTRSIRNDVVAALRNIAVPNIRWPCGCYAETYHWRDDIGARAMVRHLQLLELRLPAQAVLVLNFAFI